KPLTASSASCSPPLFLLLEEGSGGLSARDPVDHRGGSPRPLFLVTGHALHGLIHPGRRVPEFRIAPFDRLALQESKKSFLLFLLVLLPILLVRVSEGTREEGIGGVSARARIADRGGSPRPLNFHLDPADRAHARHACRVHGFQIAPFDRLAPKKCCLLLLFLPLFLVRVFDDGTPEEGSYGLALRAPVDDRGGSPRLLFFHLPPADRAHPRHGLLHPGRLLDDTDVRIVSHLFHVRQFCLLFVRSRL
ncbi:unnamed protein product, partial [Musa acuminata subsp. burmannicoides]